MIKLKKDRLAINKFHFKGMHCIYVRVQFYPWFIFSFPLFQTYYNTQKQKKIKFEPRLKLNHNAHIHKVVIEALLVKHRATPIPNLS